MKFLFQSFKQAVWERSLSSLNLKSNGRGIPSAGGRKSLDVQECWLLVRSERASLLCLLSEIHWCNLSDQKGEFLRLQLLNCLVQM